MQQALGRGGSNGPGTRPVSCVSVLKMHLCPPAHGFFLILGRFFIAEVGKRMRLRMRIVALSR